MRPGSAVSINYQEIRYLSLMSGKWTGSGCFYALLPDVMIKEQIFPEHEVMAIRGTELYYFNQKSGEKHQGDLTEQGGPVAHTTAFKGLMSGDQAYLNSLYDIDFRTKPGGWIIKLTAKNSTGIENTFKVNMRGLPGQVANKLELIMADGDRTEFMLSPAKYGTVVELKIRELFDLLGAR